MTRAPQCEVSAVSIGLTVSCAKGLTQSMDGKQKKRKTQQCHLFAIPRKGHQRAVKSLCPNETVAHSVH